MFYAFLCILCILIQGTMVEQLCLNGLPCINIFVIKIKKKCWYIWNKHNKTTHIFCGIYWYNSVNYFLWLVPARPDMGPSMIDEWKGIASWGQIVHPFLCFVVARNRLRLCISINGDWYTGNQELMPYTYLSKQRKILYIFFEIYCINSGNTEDNVTEIPWATLLLRVSDHYFLNTFHLWSQVDNTGMFKDVQRWKHNKKVFISSLSLKLKWFCKYVARLPSIAAKRQP